MSGDTSLERRTAPIEVLVLGLCRTGTTSMKIALDKLGYGNVYHFSSVFELEDHSGLWIAALRAKFEQMGKNSENTFNTKYWDRILEGYNAVTDIPCACFAPEFITAYPNAKFILTTRPTMSLHASMLRTIHALQVSYMNRFLLLFSNPYLRRISFLVDLIIEHYFRGSIPFFGMAVFEKHNEMVRAIARKEGRELLEFQWGDGWEELCGFLGKPVLDWDFPHVNERNSWRKSFGLGWSGRNILLVGLPIFVGFLAASLAFR